ncbi:MAG: L-seryl-tRNA(Sec) selenium transferase [Chloroflexia bacterium]
MERGLRALPAVDRVLQEMRALPEGQAYPHALAVEAIRLTLEEARGTIAAGGKAPSLQELCAQAMGRLREWLEPTLRPAINASGVILHTNLGRAPLSRSALEAVRRVGEGYCNLEYDLETGRRGSRHEHARSLLCRLTGAESAFVVNNNAAAVLLALSALACGREVIVSRGQAVEIGGGFRIPEVMRQSGAHLVEVGTTNRTYLRDYEAAITPQTAALLRVHRSNFALVGFVEDVPLPEMVSLARRHGLIVIDDLGSGALLDTARFGLAHEPTAVESVQAGADIVCFSGDKLLGGPQAGLIVGRAEWIARLERHPLARAVRIDKTALAALEATLLHYLRDEALREIPIWRMIAEPAAEVRRRARRWQRAFAQAGLQATVVPAETAVGGGSLPGQTLPTWAVEIAWDGPAEEAARRLREGQPPIVPRIEGDRLLLDPRTVLPEQERVLLREVVARLGRARPS